MSRMQTKAYVVDMLIHKDMFRTTSELRERARAIGLPSSGSRSALVKRLTSAYEKIEVVRNYNLFGRR